MATAARKPDNLDVRTWHETGGDTPDGLPILINPATGLECVASRWGLYSPAAYQMHIDGLCRDRARLLAVALDKIAGLPVHACDDARNAAALEIAVRDARRAIGDLRGVVAS